MWHERVLFIDGEALVIDKPAGLAVTRGKQPGESLEDHLVHLRFGFQRPPSPVHRLDRDTSGCLLLSRNPKAHKRFAAAFEAGAVAKTYLAVIDGVPAVESGIIELPLAKASTREAGWRMVADPRGKAAVTAWSVVAVIEARALVRFAPRTGRTHQIRVHAATGLNLPIAGDPVYGRTRGPMLLHAAALRLERGDKPPIIAEAPLPPTFLQAGFGND